MLFDLAAWTVLIVVALVAGSGVLALLGAEHLRAGDRFILGTWLGVVLVALVLLAAALFIPLTTGPAITVAGVLALTALVVLLRRRARDGGRRGLPDAPTPVWAVAAGIAVIAAGAAALASDPVTLYDSLVYHVGIIRWLHEHGIVPGIALIHNRLGHVSAWFTLGAVFGAGAATGQTANVPSGLALVLVAMQASIGCARIAVARATGSDWFLTLASAALIWAAVMYDAATPSPDVAANALIVVAAWSMLIVPRAGMPARTHGWRRWLGPRLVPFVIAVGASAMKLFALPAAIVAGVFYVFARADDRGARNAVRRAAVCTAVGVLLLAPFLAANFAASGCPLFPSPLGCLTAPWSVGTTAAADYAEYIRDVARWESRRSMAGASAVPWVGPWIATHPLLTTLVALAPLLAWVLLRGPRRDGVRSALLLAVCGIAFAAWQAPAPRFLYAFVVVVPALALGFPLASAELQTLRPAAPAAATRRAAVGFIASAVVTGFGYAIASQKLNVRSGITRSAAIMPSARSELVMPAAAPPPRHLYHWRVNDVDVLTPVPRPIADTLGYRSDIDGNVGFEKCSTAPLPCTPYLPSSDVHYRVPARGAGAGFVRIPIGAEPSRTATRCVGEWGATAAATSLAQPSDGSAVGAPGCGERNGR